MALGFGQFIGRRSEPERGAFDAATDHGRRRWKWDAEECGLKKGRRTSSTNLCSSCTHAEKFYPAQGEAFLRAI